MSTELRPAFILIVVMGLILGVIYPVIVTGIARTVFPMQAQGSLVYRNGGLIGSHLIGQAFSDPKYFWGRPSATSPQPYNGLASSASNFGALNPDLSLRIQADLKRLREASGDAKHPVPADLVEASGSGLDPEVSLAAALYQVSRVARARGLDPKILEELVRTRAVGSLFGFLGEARINVLDLNLALDDIHE
ncbi:MAG TPA: potassium-transporting ATPase subunit KdpC [Steroidobacteraceae bacterium]|jgi:K+-transporting ATPase ATPase C chain